MVVQKLDGGVAEAALGHVDDALEGKVVGLGIDAAQIGERVADFGALIETQAPDHPYGQAEGEETILEFAHLKRRAHKNGDRVERMAVVLQVLDLLADDAGLLLGVPGGGHRHLLASLALRTQRLAETAFVVGDEMGGCGKNMGGRAVVALQADHLGARKILLETQDVVDLGAAPAIDRLVVVADAADVLGGAGFLPSPNRSRLLPTSVALLSGRILAIARFGWGGVGGGGVWHNRATTSRPPTPTLPQPKLRIRRFRPIIRVLEIGNSRFRLGGGRRSEMRAAALPP